MFLPVQKSISNNNFYNIKIIVRYLVSQLRKIESKSITITGNELLFLVIVSHSNFRTYL